MKKKLYKTVFQVEVLSEDPIEDSMSLEDIAREGSEGNFSIKTKDILSNDPVIGIYAVKELEKHGSDPEFFMMDSEGNEIEM